MSHPPRPESAIAPWRSATFTRLTAPRRRPHIVVAEDDADMRRLVVDALRKDGYDVAEVTDGGRLLVQITSELTREGGSEESIDLIVSDVRMPVCTGIDILRGLREAHWSTPVILMTAFGDDETRAKVERLGGLLFDKPFQLEDLRTAVLNMLPREPAPGIP